MTYKRVVDAFRKIYDSMTVKDLEIQECLLIIDELITEWNEMKEYVYKYRWHDLRKNQEDLPEKCGFYIACVEHPTNHTRNTREVQLYNIVNGECVWRKNNRFLLEKSVIAWREIEEFEVEEE